MPNKKIKALVLLSGGLDSILAVKVLQEQNIEVAGLVVTSIFFNAKAAKEAASQLDVKLIVKDFSKKHLKLVKNPPHGYGKNMNPCIDCHALMFKLAKKEMKRGGFNFVATGEVLNERPMSQNKNALRLIEKEAGLFGYLLRPLSAQLLPPTVPEKRGLVDRGHLLGISGRGRRPQLELAKKYKIKKFPTPAGGCLLTDPGFSDRFKNLLQKFPKAKIKDTQLLKVGRHFWQDKNLFVVGRNHQENLKLKELKKRKDLLAEAKNVPGPSILIRSFDRRLKKRDLAKQIKKYLLEYNNKAKEIEINWL